MVPASIFLPADLPSSVLCANLFPRLRICGTGVKRRALHLPSKRAIKQGVNIRLGDPDEDNILSADPKGGTLALNEETGMRFLGASAAEVSLAFRSSPWKSLIPLHVDRRLFFWYTLA